MRYYVGVDVGGTFTDFFIISEEGKQYYSKTFTTPHDPSFSFITGLKNIAVERGISINEFVEAIDLIVHGTTMATNALLTGRYSKAALLCTKGFRDVLEIRRGLKSEFGDPMQMYNVHMRPPSPVIPRRLRLGVKERVTSEGRVIKPVSLAEIKKYLHLLEKENINSIAVCFLHSYANDINERKAAQLIRKIRPDLDLTISSELLPKVGYYERTSTTALNAVLNPIMKEYLTNLTLRLKSLNFKGTLLIMQSNGGVTTPDMATQRSVTTISSGPAAGPVACLFYASTLSKRDIICTDMGGTSFDVSILVEGRVAMVDESEFAGYKIALPTVDVISIGAGGGSIAWVDEGGMLHVGPQSAGSDPGPACYGRGGTKPTVTDANVLLGYIDPYKFLGGRFRLDINAARKSLNILADSMGCDTVTASEAIYNIVNANMSDAIRLATIKRGHDPRKFMMIAAGGAGPLHAASIADQLEIPIVLVPNSSAIFCAMGLLMSPLRYEQMKTYRILISKLNPDEIRKIIHTMMANGEKRVLAPNKDVQMSSEIYVHAKYVGQYHEIAIPISPIEINDPTLAEIIAGRFNSLHKRLYGWNMLGQPLEIVNLRVATIGVVVKPSFKLSEKTAIDVSEACHGKREIILNGQQVAVQAYEGSKLRFGHELSGPAVVDHDMTTVLIPDGFDLIVDAYNSFLIFKEDVREEVIGYMEGLKAGAD
jgi:N-methylhydantoinase A